MEIVNVEERKFKSPRVREFVVNDHGRFTVTFIAGVHGNEYGAMLLAGTIADILSEHDDNLLSANPFIHSVYILQYANVTGFINDTRDMVINGANDLNRMWGDTVNVRELIKQLVRESDVVIDMHTSPQVAQMFLLERCDNTSGLMADILMDRTLKVPTPAFGMRHTDPNEMGMTIKSYVNSMNKIGLTWEQKHYYPMYHDEYVDYCIGSVDMIFPVVCKIANLLDKCGFNQEGRYKIDSMTSILTHSAGIVNYSVKLGAYVSRGEEIARIEDLNGVVVDKITSPYRGIILTLCDTPYARCGSEICLLQPLPE